MSTDNPEEDLGPISDEELLEALGQLKKSAESQDADEDTTLHQLPPGVRPEIIKEEIDDPGILNRLMGSASTSETADYDAGSDLLSQEELDRLLEGREEPEPDGDRRIIELAGLPREKNKVEREKINDPSVLAQLMGNSEASDSEVPDSSIESFDQAEVDKLIEENMKAQAERAAQEDDSIPVDMSVKPTGFQEVEEDLGILSQEELDLLISGGSPHEPVTDTPESESPEEAFDQSAIDALIAGETEEPATPEEPAADEAFDQSAIDALIAGETEEPPAPEEPAADEAFDQSAIDALIAGETEEPAADEAFDQSAIDALIAGETEETPAPEEPAAAEAFDQSAIDALIAGGTEEPAADESFDQSAIDALIAGETEETPAPEEPAADEAFDQSDIDALIAGASGADGDAEDTGALDQAAIDALMDGDTDDASDEADAGGAIDQAEIDALLAGAMSDVEEPDEADASGAIDQSDIDALIAGSMNEAEEPQDGGAEDSSAISQDDIDALLAEGLTEGDGKTDALEALLEDELKTISSEDDDSLLSEGDSTESLDEVDMEERLDGATEEQLADEVDEPEAAAEEEPVGIIEQLLAESEAAPEPPADEVVEEVAGENLVAGASADTDETVDEESTEEKSKEEAVATEAADVSEEASEELEFDDDSEVEESLISAGEWMGDMTKVPRVVLDIAREQPYRAMTGMAAGIIMAITSFLYLSANQMRSMSDYDFLATSDGNQLRRAMTTAELLIQEENYIDASDTIRTALEDANPRNPDYLDARYIKLDADLLRATDPVSFQVASRLHTELDDIVAQSPLHPRRAEALFWKGQLYEKENNLLGARVEYRELLQNEIEAGNRQQVLLALGRLELVTDRPIEAANYLQELRRQFPGTNEASKARLLLGDAFVASGDTESARATFIGVAESNPANKIGAEAFARLGELAYESGNYEQAIRELESRLDTATTVEGNDQVTLLLAKAYRSSGRLEDAKNLLNGLIDFFPESKVTPLARVELSRVLDDLDLPRDAVRYATQIVQTYPDHPDVLRNAGELLQKNGDALDAARALLAAHFAGADDPELLLAAGKLFAEAGDNRETKKALRSLASNYASTPQGLMGHIELSKLLFDEGRISDALDRLEGLSIITNSSSRKLPILAALGELYKKLNLPSKVAESYGQIAVMTGEPELLAQSAIAILESGVVDDGLNIAAGIDVQQLTSPTAYTFLNAMGRGISQRDARNANEGLGYLEQAHAGYPDQRTSRGVQELLEANLSLDRTARARAIVSELGAHVMQRDNLMERPRLERAAITWGDYLFAKGDYRGANDAYATALQAQVVGGDSMSPNIILSDNQIWSMFQRANAYFKLSDFDDSIALYDRVAETDSDLSAEVATKATSARLEQRLRGQPVAEARNAG